jgi:hypothetical protein
MKNNKEVLSSILKTTQMGQIGIRAVLNHAVRSDLRSALQSQLREYDAIEAEAHGIAASRGLEPEELDPAIKAMAMVCARANLAYGNVDSKIAAMMIQGNTRGMIKGLKNRHHAKDPDARIMALSQKLLDCEDANIRQMQGYV